MLGYLCLIVLTLILSSPIWLVVYWWYQIGILERNIRLQTLKDKLSVYKLWPGLPDEFYVRSELVFTGSLVKKKYKYISVYMEYDNTPDIVRVEIARTGKFHFFDWQNRRFLKKLSSVDIDKVCKKCYNSYIENMMDVL